MAALKVGQSKRAAMERRDLDCQVDRELKERFAECTFVDTDVRLQDGQSMRQELRYHKLVALQEKKRLSSVFWSNFRARWVRVNSPAAQLTVKNPAEPVEPGLICALDKARTPNTKIRTPTPLISWLQASKGTPNQKTIVGLYKHPLSAHPTAGRHLQQVLAIMKWSQKFDAKRVCKEEAAAMHGHWDLGLCAHLGNMSKAGMAPQKFVEANQDIISLVLDSDDVKKVAAAGTNIRQVSDELRKLVSSGQLGARLYGTLLSGLAEKEFLAAIDEIIKDVLGDGDITEDDVKKAVERCRQAAEKWEVDQRCPQRRELEVWYRSLKLLVVVGHSNEIITAKIQSHCKSVGVLSGKLHALWFEDAILPREQKKQIADIEDVLLVDGNNMRALINAEAKLVAPTTGDLAVAMIERKLPQLISIDASGTLELALACSLASGPGADKLRDMMLECLPTASRPIEIQDAIPKLEHLMKGALYAFASRPAQGMIGEILSVLKSVARGYSPTFTSWSGDPVLKQVRDENMPFFIKHTQLEKKLMASMNKNMSARRH